MKQIRVLFNYAPLSVIFFFFEEKIRRELYLTLHLGQGEGGFIW